MKRPFVLKNRETKKRLEQKKKKLPMMHTNVLISKNCLENNDECMHEYMYVCVYMHVHVFMCVCTFVCTYACIHVCTYVGIYIYMFTV